MLLKLVNIHAGFHEHRPNECFFVGNQGGQKMQCAEFPVVVLGNKSLGAFQRLLCFDGKPVKIGHGVVATEPIECYITPKWAVLQAEP